MLGEKINQLRKKRGYSITQLAKMANISKSYLSEIEKGGQTNPSLQILKKIAISLEVSLEVLIENAEENCSFDTDLDEEWILLIKQAIKDGMKKEDFQMHQDFIQFQSSLRNKPKK
ncbi:helix-turn-helix domain-containing protein [Neobacillus vireti]|uniref:helix-turn-helix domain-containing protein n=1 Tax=Neobacillus vireti TaxID=220686 RepID=UPI002FFE41E4